MEFQNILGEKSPEKACRGVIAREYSDRGNLSQCVILSVTKDLKACTAVHRHGDLEILHSVQNDRVFVIARLGTSRGNLSPSMSS